MKYSREVWQKTLEAIKKINEIREKRQGHFIMQRLRKGRDKEIEMDVKDVQKNMTLIRSPAAGLKERRAKEAEQEAMMMEQEEEEITYVDARELEKKLEENPMADYEMMTN